MLNRKAVYFFKVLSGIAIIHRNEFNTPTRWKRALLFIPWYLLSLLIALLDLLFFGDLFVVLVKITAKNRRKLTEEEIAYFNICKGDHDFLKTVYIVECSRLARFGRRLAKRKQLGLGVATTIHFCRMIETQKRADKQWLVHEVAHTLQYKYRGLAYIIEAIIAQHASGYDFGGKKVLDQARTLKTFNPEQQAEIFTTLTLTGYDCALVQEIKNGAW